MTTFCRRTTIIAAGVLVLGFFAARPSYAQSSPTSLATTTAPVTTIASIPQQISDLRATYREQLATYRNDERLYLIAKEQYTKLQTLTALEEAARATRQAMITRQQVLVSYFTLLKLTLIQTGGLDIQKKTAQVESVDQLLADLRSHGLSVNQATDRPKIAATALEFLALSPQIDKVANETLMYIAYGRLQSVHDKTAAIQEETTAYVDTHETEGLVLAEKHRGLDEISRTLAALALELVEIRKALFSSQSLAGSSSLDQLVDDLDPIYAGLSRALNYMTEMTR